MTKAELVANIERDRARLDELLAALDGARMTEPALDDGWSVKDALAHITSWEQLCLGWIRAGERREGPFTDDSLNALNARIYAENRDRPLVAVLARSRQSSAEILAVTESLSDEALAAPPAWAPGRPLAEIISGNADDHYREHIDQINAWLARANA